MPKPKPEAINPWRDFWVMVRKLASELEAKRLSEAEQTNQE